MSDYSHIDANSSNDILVSSDMPIDDVKNNSAITPQVMAFYAQRASETKIKIDQMGAETSQRQDKMRHINDLIAEINNLTDAKQCLDISNNVELQEKLKVAKQLGVHINETKLKFDSLERDRLLQNLHLAADNWDKENKNQTQKMDILIKELDRIMMMLKDVQKNENQAKRGALAGIKG